MSEPVLIALIGAVAALLSGILVELIRTRRKTAKVEAEVTPNGGSSMKDALGRIEKEITEVRAEQRDSRTEQSRNGERLAAVEARLSDHLLIHQREA